MGYPRRAVQVTKVSKEFLAASTAPITALVDLPPIAWVVQGPRGGRYLASLERERLIVEMDDDFMHGTVSVMDRSRDTKYIRPRSKLDRDLKAGVLPVYP